MAACKSSEPPPAAIIPVAKVKVGDAMIAVVSVDVGVCTYRREAVRETLMSVAGQRLPPGVKVRVVVADNDIEPEAAARVRAAAAAGDLDLHYVHAPSRNISLARNACLDAATGDFIAFIDDDEVASADWLAALLAEAGRGGWDAVLGPVNAVYGPAAPGWMKDGDFHSTRPVKVRGLIPKGYAGNVLIRRAAIETRGLRFDLSRGRQGGEDDDFFYRLTDSGGTIGFAPDAWAEEPVPDGRTSLRWLIKRSFRTGQTHGARLLDRHAGLSRWRQIGLAGGKVAVSLGGAALSAFSESGRNRWLLRACLHAGAVARLAGVSELELY